MSKQEQRKAIDRFTYRITNRIAERFNGGIEELILRLVERAYEQTEKDLKL